MGRQVTNDRAGFLRTWEVCQSTAPGGNALQGRVTWLILSTDGASAVQQNHLEQAPRAPPIVIV